MPLYGYFQNFGVAGFEGGGDNKDQEPLDDITKTAFGDVAAFQFGTGYYSNDGGTPWGAYYSGINAASFLVVADFVKEVTDYVNENLEL